MTDTAGTGSPSRPDAPPAADPAWRGPGPSLDGQTPALPPRRHPAGRDPSLRVPLWVRLLDLATVALVVAAVYVFVFGGVNARIFGIRLLIKSPMRALKRAAAIAIVRHLVYRRPTLAARLRSGLQQARPTWQAWERRWPVAFTVVPIAIVTRLLVLAVGLVAVLVLGYAPAAPPYRISVSELANLPIRWDAGWYLTIALEGYAWTATPRGQETIAFFPAYPMLIRAVGLFRLDRQTEVWGVWLAVLVSVVLFAGALAYVYRLAVRAGTPDAARTSVLLLAAYPYALFFGLPYTESLFLLATAGAISHQVERQYGRAALFALVAGLSRPNGVLVGVPLGLFLLRHFWADWRSTPGATVGGAVGRTWPGLLAVLAPALGVGIFSFACWWHTGNAFPWLQAQAAGWNRSSTQFWRFFDDLHKLLAPGLEVALGWRPFDVFNLLASVLALLAIWPVGRRLGPELAAYVAVSTMVPLVYGGLMSMGRFTSVLFPIFLWLGLALGPRARDATLLAFVAGQTLLAAFFFTWRPVF